MPVELLVPIGIFVIGVIIATLASSNAVAVIEENRKGGK